MISVGGGQKRLRSEKGSRAKLHDERIARFQNGEARPKIQEPMFRNNGEAEVVLGEQLSHLLRKFVVEWLAERPLRHVDTGTKRGESRGHNFMGPNDFLAEKTGIHIRRVTGIINGEFSTVGLSQADALLQAANLTHLLDTDEIRVIPNPSWSMEKWNAYMEERGCC